MRVFISQLITETNTFTPLPTGPAGFAEMGVHHGNATAVDPDGVFTVLTRWRRTLEREGHLVVEGLGAQAQPGGRTLRALYEGFRDEIIREIKANLPLDAVLLNLHGAMSAQGYDDCEGDLIAGIRKIVGPDTRIGVELDLHCHFTEAMFSTADILVAYKHYPHTDLIDRADEVADLTLAAAAGTIKPTTSVADCHMVGLWHTTREPMARFVRKMAELEDGVRVLSVSLGHGFPWGDVKEAGARLWVITNDDKALAARLALELANELFAMRVEIDQSLLSIDAALDFVEGASAFPIVAADGADNPGGGAPSDSTFILDRVIERKIQNTLFAFLYDPIAVNVLAEAGVGAALDMRIGGKTGVSSGTPVDLHLEVRAVVEDHYQNGLGLRWPLGRTVWARGALGLDIVLTSNRSQPFDPSSLESLGINLSAKRLIVVKSIQHFQAGFAPLAAGGVIYIAAHGALTPDFRSIPYRTKSLDYWPRREDVAPALIY